MARKSETRTPDCPHNTMLICPPGERDCTRCGWSPKVAARRLQKLRKKYR